MDLNHGVYLSLWSMAAMATWHVEYVSDTHLYPPSVVPALGPPRLLRLLLIGRRQDSRWVYPSAIVSV
jgi:hypothetical protein